VVPTRPALRAAGGRVPMRRVVSRVAQVARLAAAALALRSAGVGAAAYLPGPEADPPTGATGRAADTVEPAGTGIEWTLAPWQTAGSISLDLRALRLADGSRTTQGLVFNDFEVATHVWQPWFVQLRAGLGLLAERDRATSADGVIGRSSSSAVTGRFGMAVFPASRFPFQFSADVSDSRTRGDTLGADYRSQRLSLSQAWRPAVGNDSLDFHLDRSRLRARSGGEDTITALRATASRALAAHSFDLSGQVSRNERSESDESSRFATLSASHHFHPAQALQVDTLASWNQVELHSGSSVGSFDSATEMRQLSSFASWRPSAGEWFYAPDAPLFLSASARVMQARTEGNTVRANDARTLNASLGASQEPTRHWRLSAGVSGTVLEPGDGRRVKSASATAAANVTPDSRLLGAWRYTPTLGVNAGASRSSDAGQRNTWGGQAAHSVSRGVTLGPTDSLSFNLAQSVGALRDSQTRIWSRALAHSVGMYWQGTGNGTSQSYGSISASDSRTQEVARGSFQLVNAQWSRRTQWSRQSSIAANLTWQASRADASQVDAFSGELRRSDPGWQRFYSGSLSIENQRFADINRLRYSLLLSVNSQRLESRAEGDIDAPLERVTASVENRLDYAIGRLDARLSARLARVDGRNVASLFARLQRRY
jgi:hypothetical protein